MREGAGQRVLAGDGVEDARGPRRGASAAAPQPARRSSTRLAGEAAAVEQVDVPAVELADAEHAGSAAASTIVRSMASPGVERADGGGRVEALAGEVEQAQDRRAAPGRARRRAPRAGASFMSCWRRRCSCGKRVEAGDPEAGERDQVGQRRRWSGRRRPRGASTSGRSSR